jgi:hypothetical protein
MPFLTAGLILASYKVVLSNIFTLHPEEIDEQTLRIDWHRLEKGANPVQPIGP